MKQNYFVYNGRKYNAGEIITVKQFDCILRRLCETSAIFINYDTEQNEYHLKINDRIVSYSEKDFNRIFCGDVENNTNNSAVMTENKKHTFMDELNIDDLFFNDVSRTVLSRRLNHLVDYKYLKRIRVKELNNSYMYY